jgi:hypothetical protein
MLFLSLAVLALVATSVHGARSVTYETRDYELPDVYDVTLKDNAPMSVEEHVQWATKVHMEHSKNPKADHLFGFVEIPDVYPRSNTYEFCSYKDAMDIIQKHPDVSFDQVSLGLCASSRD